MTMWYAKLARRELLDALITGWRPALSKVERFEDLPKPDLSSFVMAWHYETPGLIDGLPCLIVSHDDSVSSLFAVLASAPQLPFPITAYLRVVTWAQLCTLKHRQHAALENGLLNGLACLAIAEASVYAGPMVASETLGSAGCGRTISFAFGKALPVLLERDTQMFLGRWMEVQTLTGGSLPIGQGLENSLACILDICEAVLDGQSVGTLGEMVRESIQFGEPSERIWLDATGDLLKAASLKEFTNGTREERGTGFQRLLAEVRSSKSPSEELIAGCALVATRIAPGTLEHLNLLLKESDQRVALWYAFLAGMQRQGAALRQKQGRALRVLRDMKMRADLTMPPRSDISYDEFVLQSRLEGDVLSKRLSHSNEVVVELYPGVDISFRPGKRNEKNESSAVGDEQAYLKALANQIMDAGKTLQELAGRVAKQSLDPRQKGRPKESKSGRLL